MTNRPTGHVVPESKGAAEDPQASAPPREPSHAERVRTLAASQTRGALSTVAVDLEGYPYGSVASYALDEHGHPLLFLSAMAEHTQNALRDPRASLLVAEPVPDGADPLASGRVTFMGELHPVASADRDRARSRYIAANPAAEYYIDFGDFDFYGLALQSIRYVGGYGRMSWVDPGEYAAAEPDPLLDTASRIIEHMNADHADAQVLFCRHFAGRPETTSASMSAVDRYGFEMIAVSDTDRAVVRLAFPRECVTADTVRQAMVEMVQEAREASG